MNRFIFGILIMISTSSIAFAQQTGGGSATGRTGPTQTQGVTGQQGTQMMRQQTMNQAMMRDMSRLMNQMQ